VPHRRHRAVLLLANQPGGAGLVAPDGRLDELVLPFEHRATSEDPSVLPGVFAEPLYLLELRLVLERAHLRTLFQPITNDRL
jgi:hypothetical protein